MAGFAASAYLIGGVKMNSDLEAFKAECERNMQQQASDTAFVSSGADFLAQSVAHKYSYNFEWLGLPIIQYPQDIVAMQQLVWQVKPELIIETGIARGGSLVFYASLLELNALCGGPAHARVLGIDIDIRAHNRAAIEQHPLARRIDMLQGSSIDPATIAQVAARAAGAGTVMVLLDSNHTHEHVLAELRAYAPLVSHGSYCVVFDTLIEDMPADAYPDRPWGKGDNPKTAVWQYLQENTDFAIEHSMDQRLLISVAPSGYLKKVR